MEKSKNQILSELYCIKAGLSAISIEKDKVSAEEKKLNKYSQKRICLFSLNFTPEFRAILPPHPDTEAQFPETKIREPADTDSLK